MGTESKRIAVVYASQMAPPAGSASFKSLACSLGEGARRFAAGTWSDFVTTNKSGGKRLFQVGATLAAGPTIAGYYETKMPLGWLLSRFGPLPAEFTKSGSIRVFEYSFGQRLASVAQAAAVRFVLVTLAFEGGVLIGSAINQTLSEKVQDAIGGTINEIVNERGWMELWKHPFGIGM
jgi:hypothetical protein